MFSLALLELMAVTGLLYSLLLIFVEVGPLEVMALLFAWTVGVSLVYYYSRPWAKPFRLSALLLLAPLYFYHDGGAWTFFLITVPLLLMYLERFLLRGSCEDYVDNFRKVALIYPVALFLRWAAPGFGEAINRSAPFIFVYFLSSILLIRSVRHVEAGMDLRRLQGTNLRYLIVIATVLLLSTLAEVRRLAGLTVRGLISLLFLPVVLALQLLGWIMARLSSWIMRHPIDWSRLQELPKLDNGGEVPPLVEGTPSPILETIFEIMRATFIALLIGGALYILYRLLLRGGRQIYRGLDYVEEREFLLRQGPRQKRRFRLWDRLPRDPAEQVRFYYRKFLEKLVRQKVELHKDDTSLEIQKKAKVLFPQGPEEIRDIYIASRYGQKAVNGEMVRRMEGLVRELEGGGHP